MGYLLIEDFAAGVDLRKSLVTAKAGSLRALSNGFVNAGGEIEKRRRLTKLGTVQPAGQTAGVAGINRSLYVFGLDAPGTITLPTPVLYHQLTPSPAAPGGTFVQRILDVEVFQNKLFVIARLSDGSVRHFFDGAQVAGVTGMAGRSHKQKVYVLDSQLVRFSAINDPTAFTSGTGYGIIDGTTEDAGAADFVGIEQYYSNLALFGRNSVQVWSMDPDPAVNQMVQVLANAGLVAANAVSRYGNGDVLFLSDTGIRSLRARDSSNAAILNDIGSPIDPLISPRRLNLTSANAEKIKALVDPLSGHFWLIWGSTVYVLAYYPATKVTAWSTFDLPFTVDYATVAGNRVVFRSGDDIYVYGAVGDPAKVFDNYTPDLSTDTEYDTTQCFVQMPMLDMRTPATKKRFTAIDVACEGVWKIEIDPSPDNPGTWIHVATVDRPTYSLNSIPCVCETTHISVRATSLNAGQATIGAFAFHFQGGEAD